MMVQESEFGSFWEGIGQSIIDHLGVADGVLMYLECERAAVGGQIYKEHPDDIEQIDPPDEVMDSVLAHWEELESTKRWAAVRYFIDGGQFKVTFDYFDLPVEDNTAIDESDDRMRLAFNERFGNKPIRLSHLIMS